MTVNEIWDLDSIFVGGSSSTALSNFLEQLSIELADFSVNELPPLTKKTETAWIKTIQSLYNLNERLRQAGSFVPCLVAQNVNDEKAMQLEAGIDQFSAKLGTHWTKLSAAFAAQNDNVWEHFVTQTELAPVAFHLNEQRQVARQKMSPEMESLVNELAADGYHAWDRLYGMTSGEKQVEFQGKPMSLGQLQNKMYDSPDRTVRQAAFELFENSWAEIAKPCAAALNNQAGFRLTLYKHRGWDSILKEPLMNNRFSADTLEAMWSVIDAKSSKLLDYFAAKTQLLGIEKLRWFDALAPVGENNRTFTYAEAARFTVDNLRQFSPDIANFAQMAIDQRWIEAEDRPGKRAGGFCTGFPLNKESRIFMTFTGSVNSMLTLAHELGHAYHSWVMRDLPPGARRYTMSVAETASTFNEEIVRDAGLKAAASDAERLSILGAKLNDTAGYLMDIRARYDFEMAFFRERAKKSLSVDELSALMVESQKVAFKDGLQTYHPLFWASKLHFYITAAPFYNFPYTFGFLFSNGVYAQAKAEGAGFIDHYIALLRDTGSMDTETLAKKHLGVNLTQPEFWESAVDRVLADVDKFVALAKKCKA